MKNTDMRDITLNDTYVDYFNINKINKLIIGYTPHINKISPTFINENNFQTILLDSYSNSSHDSIDTKNCASSFNIQFLECSTNQIIMNQYVHLPTEQHIIPQINTLDIIISLQQFRFNKTYIESNLIKKLKIQDVTHILGTVFDSQIINNMVKTEKIEVINKKDVMNLNMSFIKTFYTEQQDIYILFASLQPNNDVVYSYISLNSLL